MLNISFRAPGGFDVRMHGETVLITSTNQRLCRGRYILSARVPGQQIEVSDKQYYHRTLSLSNTQTEPSFCEQVRARDGRCVITGQVNLEAQYNEWTGFDAAHIVPLALSNIFNQLITHNQSLGVNSPQNGILLRTDIHQLWDSYCLAVNPNNGYRVQAFRPNSWYLHGKVLHPVCRRPNHSAAFVDDALLTWHYEQAVLCNMRGAGEPIFEHDFPPSSDMIGTILQGA